MSQSSDEAYYYSMRLLSVMRIMAGPGTQSSSPLQGLRQHQYAIFKFNLQQFKRASRKVLTKYRHNALSEEEYAALVAAAPPLLQSTLEGIRHLHRRDHDGVQEIFSCPRLGSNFNTSALSQLRHRFGASCILSGDTHRCHTV
jgi:hypothetical protein